MDSVRFEHAQKLHIIENNLLFLI